jgi:hypothetical protein
MDIIDEEESSSSPGTSNYFSNLNNLNHPMPFETSTENGGSSANLWVDLTFGGDVCLFACLWGDCQQRFAEREKFEAHMETHLANYANQLILSNNGQSFITQNIKIITIFKAFGANNNPICQVRGCQIIVTSVEELSRHLKMHIFHANKQLMGLHSVRERYPNLKK